MSENMQPAMRGRPKRYENQAEKQKAYRERQKTPVPALRKSPAEIWQDRVQVLDAEYNAHQKRFRDMDYDDWRKQHHRIYEACCEASHRAYYLRCYESDWFITASVRARMMPDILSWIAELEQ
jgi:DNA-binding GntR family transcriptional regulator